MSSSIDDEIRSVARASADWAARPPSERADVLRQIADGLDDAADELVPLAMAETQLAEPRLRGELKRTTFQLRLFADEVDGGGLLEVRLDRADEHWPMGAPRPDLRRMLVPIGPVLVFAASNFPFAFSIAGGDTAAAWAAGNAVLVKAHPGHPELSDATAAVITRVLADAAAPQDLLRVIHGREDGVSALQHPLIRAASFTGSITGGRALFDVAAARPEPIPFYGELGSVNPAFVLPGAARSPSQQIASAYLASVTGSQGQLCTKPGLLLVPAGSTVLEELGKLEAPGAAPLLNSWTHDGYLAALEQVASHIGVYELTGDTATRSAPGSALGTEPVAVTLLVARIEEVLSDVEGLVTEVFGPAGLVVEYDDPSDVVELAKRLPGQLTATLLGDDEEEDDLQLARDLVPVLQDRAGRLLWNQWPTGVSVTHAQQHGGPYPATTAPTTTSVGTAAISRFLRPVAYQNFPVALLPEPLQDANPLGVPQRIDG